MTHPSQNLQPSLFDENAPHIELQPAQRADLAAGVEILLGEIAAVLASRESGDDQDHG